MSDEYRYAVRRGDCEWWVGQECTATGWSLRFARMFETHERAEAYCKMALSMRGTPYVVRLRVEEVPRDE